MSGTIAKMYEKHHTSARPEGFSILEKDRGELFKKYSGQKKAVLDIGCRDGTLTRWFSEGNEVTGVEIDPKSAAKARDLLKIDVIEMDLHGDWGDLTGRHFDTVVAGEVLEHLFYPAVVVEKVKAHLTVEGVFIGSVPNAFSLKNRIRLFFGTKKGTPLQDPTHINHFSAQELRSILSNHFTNVEIFGLGRFRTIARLFPGLFAFDLCFVARD